MMGRNHLRIYRTIAGVDLVGVVDVDAASAADAAETFGCRSFDSPAALAGSVDAVSIASPSATHADVAVPFLERGVHCLVEKPLATSEADAIRMIEAATTSGAALLVGHVERFNPAVQALGRMLGSGARVRALDARRMSAVSSRITDVDVVLDLMIHDIDIILSIVREPLADLAAFAAGPIGPNGADYVQALLSFQSGVVASLTASRITENKIRELQLTTDRGYVELGYSTQELLVYREGAFASPTDFGADYVLDVTMERVAVRKTEPLLSELQHFVEVASAREKIAFGPTEALDALRVAWRVQDAVRTSS
jgi:predicted dehydrogenase